MDIKTILNHNNIEEYGIIPSQIFNELKAQELLNVPFMHFEIEERINPYLLMEDVKSIIVYHYPYEIKPNSQIPKLHGCISGEALKEEYHLVINRVNEKIIAKLQQVDPTIKAMGFCDTGPLVDKYLSYTAGLGFFGKNNLIISPKYGTRFNIGYILINKVLEDKKEKNNEKLCGTCRKCMNACPTDAITENGYDYKKCISFLTQKKADLTLLEREALGNNIYGCDICQTACPFNDRSLLHRIYQKKVSNVINLLEILELSNREIKETYSGFGFLWRGGSLIKRNALIALGNYEAPAVYDQVRKYIGHPSPKINIYALWALAKSDGSRFKKLNVEPSLKKEYNYLLEELNIKYI